MNHIPSNERVICDLGFIYQFESWDDSMTQRLTLPVSCCRNPLRSYHTLEGRCSPRCRVSEIDESPSKGSLPSTAQGYHLKKHLAELSCEIPSCLLIDLEVYHSWTRDALGGATLMQSEISRVALMVWSLQPEFWIPQTPKSVLETDLLILRELHLSSKATTHSLHLPTLSFRTFLTSKSPIFIRLHKKCVRFDLFWGLKWFFSLVSTRGLWAPKPSDLLFHFAGHGHQLHPVAGLSRLVMKCTRKNRERCLNSFLKAVRDDH